MSTHLPTENLSGIGQQRAALFAELDKRAREMERQCKETWVELADLCVTIRDSQLWQEGGYHSYHAWLQDACPTSRTTAYLAVGIREELSEIPKEELKQMPIGNAEVLKQTPKKARKKLMEAAKNQAPREFVATVIREVPEAHQETKVVHKFRMLSSASKKLTEALDRWRLLNQDPEAPVEDALEGVISDYLLQTESEYEAASRSLGRNSR